MCLHIQLAVMLPRLNQALINLGGIFKKMGQSRPLFLYFRLFNPVNKFSISNLLMTGFELKTSGIGSKCSTNCATTTALRGVFLLCNIWNISRFWFWRRRRRWWWENIWIILIVTFEKKLKLKTTTFFSRIHLSQSNWTLRHFSQ